MTSCGRWRAVLRVYRMASWRTKAQPHLVREIPAKELAARACFEPAVAAVLPFVVGSAEVAARRPVPVGSLEMADVLLRAAARKMLLVDDVVANAGMALPASTRLRGSSASSSQQDGT